jgi:hypothetical protein
MSLALQRTLKPSPGRPATTAPTTAETRLNVVVVFTNVASTLIALKKAGKLSAQLNTHITVLVPQVVPYPLPLESPPVLLEWNERRLRVMAEESPVETTVKLYLCRDRIQALLPVLQPRSVVVIGGHKRWWPTPETKLASKLRSAGHEVIFAEAE